jgi:hypothetical protein
MTLDDLKLAFQIFDVACVPHLIALGFCHVEEFLGLDQLFLLNHFPEMALEEKLDLLYAVEMIDAKQLNPKVHCENCGVCSSENVLTLLREYC